MEKVRQGLLLRDKLIAEQRTDDVRTLGRNLLLTTARPTGVEHETDDCNHDDDDDDDDDDRYKSIIRDRSQGRCVAQWSSG